MKLKTQYGIFWPLIADRKLAFVISYFLACFDLVSHKMCHFYHFMQSSGQQFSLLEDLKGNEVFKNLCRYFEGCKKFKIYIFWIWIGSLNNQNYKLVTGFVVHWLTIMLWKYLIFSGFYVVRTAYLISYQLR